MSERVEIYVGDRLTDASGRRPTIAFDLLPGVELLSALREVVSSMERIDRGEIVAGPPPRTRKAPMSVREWLAAPQASPQRFGDDLEMGNR